MLPYLLGPPSSPEALAILVLEASLLVAPAAGVPGPATPSWCPIEPADLCCRRERTTSERGVGPASGRSLAVGRCHSGRGPSGRVLSRRGCCRGWPAGAILWGLSERCWKEELMWCAALASPRVVLVSLPRVVCAMSLRGAGPLGVCVWKTPWRGSGVPTADRGAERTVKPLDCSGDPAGEGGAPAFVPSSTASCRRRRWRSMCSSDPSTGGTPWKEPLLAMV